MSVFLPWPIFWTLRPSVVSPTLFASPRPSVVRPPPYALPPFGVRPRDPCLRDRLSVHSRAPKSQQGDAQQEHRGAHAWAKAPNLRHLGLLGWGRLGGARLGQCCLERKRFVLQAGGLVGSRM